MFPGKPHNARQRYLRRGQELGGGADLWANQGREDSSVLCVYPLRGQPPRLLQRRLSVSQNCVSMLKLLLKGLESNCFDFTL